MEIGDPSAGISRDHRSVSASPMYASNGPCHGAAVGAHKPAMPPAVQAAANRLRNRPCRWPAAPFQQLCGRLSGNLAERLNFSRASIDLVSRRDVRKIDVPKPANIATSGSPPAGRRPQAQPAAATHPVFTLVILGETSIFRPESNVRVRHNSLAVERPQKRHSYAYIIEEI